MGNEKEHYYLEIEEDHNDDEKPEFILPSEIEKKKPIRKSNKKKSFKIKWIVIITLLVLAYLFYDRVLFFILETLKQNPTFYKYYLTIESQIINNTVFGLLILSFLGALFFLSLPSEALFIYFLNATSYNPVIIITLILFGNVAGLIFNYVCGFLLGEKILRWMFKKNFEKYKEITKRYGGVIIFFGNILPGPIEALSVFYGGFKFDFKRYVFLSFMGRLIKYIILFFLFLFFWDSIIAFYEDFLNLFRAIL